MKQFVSTAALAAGCLAAALLCAWGCARLTAGSVSEKLTRLQIVAHSDSEEDQEIKRAVRDRVQARVRLVTAECTDKRAAEAALREALAQIEAEAQETVYASGRVYPARARLERVEYPFRDYGSFALPAGEYTALRVILGDGEGQNWWCVAFPALCEPLAEAELGERARGAGFSERELAFIRSDGARARFFLLELFEKWFA